MNNKIYFKAPIENWELSDTPDEEYPFMLSGALLNGISINIMMETEKLSEERKYFVEVICEDSDSYINKTTEYIRKCLLQNPEEFNLTEDDKTIIIGSDHLLLSEPKFCFYSSEEWVVHFAEGNLSICEPFGIGITYLGKECYQFDDFSDAEVID